MKTIKIELCMMKRGCLQEHRGWWAVEEKPDAQPGDLILFACHGDIFERGRVKAIIPPNSDKPRDYTGKDFHESWWRIGYLPLRIQRKRKKGFRLPSDAVVVTRPTKWGNPFKEEEGHAGSAVNKYRRWLATNPQGMKIAAAAKVELRGKRLACFCGIGMPCHADVLIEVANGSEG